ncbi:hypothetical protein IH980_04005 [Patescibacteria group bacterium]|nr:hypothetical protein [Patescibacteria group bacterium]
MSEKEKSFLVFTVQRETQPGSGEFSSREARLHYTEPSGDIKFARGYSNGFEKVGPRVAFVQQYREGMLDKLSVDAVIEVDSAVMEEPVVVEQTTTNMAGMTLGYDESRLAPNRSMESLMLVSGGEFQGPVQAGFVPREKAYCNLGKSVDGRQVRLQVQDVRPKAAHEVPPVSRV